MKLCRSDVRGQAYVMPKLKFENQSLTSFAGLVLFIQFFTTVELKARLRGCFRHLAPGKIFSRSTIFLQLVIHLLLGFRELRDCQAYRNDPMVQRLLGLKRLPDAATLSCMLKEADAKTVENVRRLMPRNYATLGCTVRRDWSLWRGRPCRTTSTCC